MQNFVLGAVDVWGLGPAHAGEDDIPNVKPAFLFCEPTRRPAAELVELTWAEALVAVSGYFSNSTSVPACCLLLYMPVKLGHLVKDPAAVRTLDVGFQLFVSAVEMLDDEACRSELVAEHAARESSRKSLVKVACQVLALHVEAAVMAEIAVVTGIAVAVLVMSWGGRPTTLSF